MKDLKILVVGCGSIGERHIKNLLSLGIKKLSAYDSDAKRLKYVCLLYTSDAADE